MGSPNPQDKVTGHSQYNAVHQYLISRPNKVNKHTFLYFTNLFDKHYQQSELRYWDLGRFVHGRIWGLNRLPGIDGENRRGKGVLIQAHSHPTYERRQNI